MKLSRNSSGFTLIELLVVIAVIGILASVVLASLNGARVKARDAKRKQDMRQLYTALQTHNIDNSAFPYDSACTNGWCCLGNGNAGTCWNGQYHGSDTIDAALVPKYIPKLSDDPLNNTARYGDAYMYRVDTDSLGSYATIHWGIENANPTASADCLGGGLYNWGAGIGSGGDYYCLLTVR